MTTAAELLKQARARREQFGSDRARNAQLWADAVTAGKLRSQALAECRPRRDRHGSAVVVANLTAGPHGPGTWRPVPRGACGCRRWTCTDCGAVVHRSRPLPWPAGH